MHDSNLMQIIHTHVGPIESWFHLLSIFSNILIRTNFFPILTIINQLRFMLSMKVLINADNIYM